ncbi:MAG TPA: ABC transporter permease, partial [Hyphomicrobium sp.]|nr:ABC transporter permease [Hyphomicrobium sp.]
KGKVIKMAPKIAYRNLFHDRMSLIVTLVGIVFSVVLVAIEVGLYKGSENKIATVLDKAPADLWIVPYGTKSFDDPSLLIGHEKYAALSTPGVQYAEDMIVSFSSWRKPAGGKKSFILIGLDWPNGGTRPWSLEEGTVEDLQLPNAVAVDRSYFQDLGIEGRGDYAEINNQRIQVTAVTKGIRSFTTLPYIFTPITTARKFVGASPVQATYVLVRLEKGADANAVRQALETRLTGVEVLTHDEFTRRSVNYWMFSTGAGLALITGMVLGAIVGVVIVAQTLYASTKDHLNEFATLRALGASASYIHAVILIQALLSAVLGYAAGMLLAMLAIYRLSIRVPTLTIVMTPTIAAYLFALTVGMCVFAAITAIRKVTRIDPAGVFNR